MAREGDKKIKSLFVVRNPSGEGGGYTFRARPGRRIVKEGLAQEPVKRVEPGEGKEGGIRELGCKIKNLVRHRGLGGYESRGISAASGVGRKKRLRGGGGGFAALAAGKK